MKNPYTENDNRLADVIAAIQVMATYKYNKLDFSQWAKRIEGDDSRGKHWETVFEQHPEFFRLGGGRNKSSLVWRRNYQKLYNVDLEEKITREDYRNLTDDEKTRISRVPLSNSDISTLINTAINLHSGELDHKKDSRWWISGAIGLLGVIVGAVIKAYAG
ncbi:N-carbamoyl-L-amino acid amidohydrolase [bacterium]|nr:N-carbamoyl-L-amino acid amidohydrolase [bacterium]